jgi:hypothetical protein
MNPFTFSDMNRGWARPLAVATPLLEAHGIAFWGQKPYETQPCRVPEVRARATPRSLTGSSAMTQPAQLLQAPVLLSFGFNRLVRCRRPSLPGEGQDGV